MTAEIRVAWGRFRRNHRREAKRRATSRSALLAPASRELERRDSEKIEPAITRSEKRFRRYGAFDAVELIRNERDSRP